MIKTAFTARFHIHNIISFTMERNKKQLNNYFKFNSILKLGYFIPVIASYLLQYSFNNYYNWIILHNAIIAFRNVISLSNEAQ